MGISPVELQVTWSTGSNSATLSTSNSYIDTSDAMTYSTAVYKAMIEVKADQTSGTPASGDTVSFYSLLTLGDPDGSTTNEYETTGHGTFLNLIDLNTDDPGIAVSEIAIGVGVKVYAVGSGFASTDEVEVSATIMQYTVT